MPIVHHEHGHDCSYYDYVWEGSIHLRFVVFRTGQLQAMRKRDVSRFKLAPLAVQIASNVWEGPVHLRRIVFRKRHMHKLPTRHISIYR